MSGGSKQTAIAVREWAAGKPCGAYCGLRMDYTADRACEKCQRYLDNGEPPPVESIRTKRRLERIRDSQRARARR